MTTRILAIFRRLALVALAGWGPTAGAAALVETPMLAAAVAAGKLPPVAERVPANPSTVKVRKGRMPGVHGGELHCLMAKQRDVRQLVVYGYARLVAYNERLELVPDLLEDVEVVENRIFTLRLRKGHRWSDGHPFTAEDFRYYWEDVAGNPDLSPGGPNRRLIVDGKRPKFEILDEHTVRYTWHAPNPDFLPPLAAPLPFYIYRPAHYLKQFHASYVAADKLAAMVKKAGTRNWAGLHHRQDHQYKNDNPELPSLQPWVIATEPPAERFVFARNPFYHRIDERGRQLPYIDQVVMTIADHRLIPAKAGSGETDLQGRYIRLDNYTFLKQAAERNNYSVRLWQTMKGSQIALYPNLNAADPVWRELLRDVRFRRALSLGIDRHEINQAIYFGLVIEGANTVLPKSPLFRPEYQKTWAKLDVAKANEILDEIGLTERNASGTRLLPDGRPLEIVVSTAGESTEETDVLELIHDSWKKIGVKLFSTPSQREVFRRRVFSGQTLMSVWSGIINGIPTPAMSPHEIAPTTQYQLQWPKWGQYYESRGQHGEPPELEPVKRLAELNRAWRNATSTEEQARIWHEMLEIHRDNVFSIGIVAGVPQPIVVSNTLRNVPEKGFYNWNPGAYFGIYRPDTFWFEKGKE